MLCTIMVLVWQVVWKGRTLFRIYIYIPRCVASDILGLQVLLYVLEELLTCKATCCPGELRITYDAK
jgi:hypothetical protein